MTQNWEQTTHTADFLSIYAFQQVAFIGDTRILNSNPIGLDKSHCVPVLNQLCSTKAPHLAIYTETLACTVRTGPKMQAFLCCYFFLLMRSQSFTVNVILLLSKT